MTARLLKSFIINAACLLLALPAAACAWTAPERWYMFEADAQTFQDHFADENLKFWNSYCKPQRPFHWLYIPDFLKAAEEKHDAAMVTYLTALEKYQEIAGEVNRDSWDYPTATELANRRASIRQLLATCRKHQTGPLAERWLLLEMRANMLLGNYAENLALWQTSGEKQPAGYLKEMLRNIYANALLNSGKKVEAWNIYAEQNDAQSLIWSARKYTNLAGLKELYAKYPGSPITTYLLRRYVNSIQDVVDIHYDYLHQQAVDAEARSEESLNSEIQSYWEEQVGDAYARIDKDYREEVQGFVQFAEMVAHDGKTPDPCAWGSAAAICAYFIGDYPRAQRLATEAMGMKGSEDVRKMARRIGMLIACSTNDINSPKFKKYMADELRWLDSDIAATKSRAAANARDRILNLGLAKNYEAKGNKRLASLIALTRDRVQADSAYALPTMTSDIYPGTSDDIKDLFATVKDPGKDPLKVYAASHLEFPDDFKNDILGTKLLQEGKWSEAIPYLEKVSMPYLDQQPIAFYAARRDYTIPAWYGFQRVGDNDYEATSRPQHLAKNTKVEFCKHMLSLEAKAAGASRAEKERLDLRRAAALYQASRFGQCWYLSQYGSSQYEPRPIKDDELAGRAIALLNDAARSADPKVRAAALFGLSYTAPDQWLTTGYDWDGSEYKAINTVHRDSRQYAILRDLTNLMDASPAANLPEISRCDVIISFRNHR